LDWITSSSECAIRGALPTQRSLARLTEFIDAQSGLDGRIECCELDISDLKQRAF
jgi:hypothetical protein